MKRKLIGVVFACSAFGAPRTQAEDVHGQCTKGSQELAVTGSSGTEQKASCQQQGGMWSEIKSDPPVSRQSSGGGGGW